jgi:hypothetical protein
MIKADDPFEFYNQSVTDYPVDINRQEHFKNGHPEGSSDIEKYLSHYIDGSDLVVFWLDNDEVGENICFQIMRMIERCDVK